MDSGEQCDGATCSATLDGMPVQATCGAPGTLHACECQNVQCGDCPGYGEGLCWPSDECLMLPGGGAMCILGFCVPTICNSPSDCGDNAPGCVDGRCCTVSPPNYCRYPGQFALPCCGSAVCGANDRCCQPAGQSCTTGYECCSGACTGGVCS